MRSPRTAVKSGPTSPQREKACAQQWRPNAGKNKLKKKKYYGQSDLIKTTASRGPMLLSVLSKKPHSLASKGN